MDTPVLIGVIGGAAALVLIIVIIVAKKRKKPARLCGQCRRVMMKDWTNCLFCGWKPVPRLEFISGPLAGQTINLDGEVTTLGSVAGNTIVLSDPAVSRKHAGIRWNGQAYELADLGSTNGVYVNGHRMPKKALVTGDVLRVGNTEFVFRHL